MASKEHVALAESLLKEQTCGCVFGPPEIFDRVNNFGLLFATADVKESCEAHKKVRSQSRGHRHEIVIDLKGKMIWHGNSSDIMGQIIDEL